MENSNRDEPVTSTPAEPSGEGTVGPEYLDLDHDGVPDAVRITTEVDYDLEGGPEIVEVVEELDSEIGDDGTPGTIEVSDTVAVDVDRDGSPEAVEVTSVTIHTHPAASED